MRDRRLIPTSMRSIPTDRPRKKRLDRRPKRLFPNGNSWLLDLGSNQGPIDDAVCSLDRPSRRSHFSAPSDTSTWYFASGGDDETPSWRLRSAAWPKWQKWESVRPGSYRGDSMSLGSGLFASALGPTPYRKTHFIHFDCGSWVEEGVAKMESWIPISMCRRCSCTAISYIA